MSASLHWKHAPKPPVEEDTWISDDFRHKAAQHYFGHDGSLSGEAHLTMRSDYAYLSGLRDAGVEDADKVIELLRKHPEGIIIYIEH